MISHAWPGAPALAALSLAACAVPDPPGELIGAYSITGALQENSCGSTAVPAADPLRFDVQVRRDKGIGLWLLAQPPAHPGRLDDDGDFSFERESSVAVDGRRAQDRPPELTTETQIEALADPERFQRIDDARQRPCRLLVRERIHGRVLRDGQPDGGIDDVGTAADAGTAESADLIGENEITFRAAPGDDCGLVLERNGGPFIELPCSVRYEIEGTLRDAQ
jgi:hypothetical protein